MTTIQYAVRNTHTGSTVGLYSESKAKGLRDEWNALALRARNITPYVVIQFAEVIGTSAIRDHGVSPTVTTVTSLFLGHIEIRPSEEHPHDDRF